MAQPNIVTFLHHQDAFTCLGILNTVTDNSDFGDIWRHFFEAGGYELILPFAADPHPLNVWTIDAAGVKTYFQCLPVGPVDVLPVGYTLRSYPAADYWVLTHEWLPTHEEAISFGIKFCWDQRETVSIPEGYVRFDAPGSPVHIIEKEHTDTPDGSRYEFWIPLRKV